MSNPTIKYYSTICWIGTEKYPYCHLSISGGGHFISLLNIVTLYSFMSGQYMYIIVYIVKFPSIFSYVLLTILHVLERVKAIIVQKSIKHWKAN